MQKDALNFWNSLKVKVQQLIDNSMRKSLQCARYDVTSAPDGSKIGVTKPCENNEIFIPYSWECADAVVGDTVLVVWWNSLSTAKAWFKGGGPGKELRAKDIYFSGTLKKGDSFSVGNLTYQKSGDSIQIKDGSQNLRPSPFSFDWNIDFDDGEQTDQRRISFKNSNGTHPHNSSFYGGSPNSTTAIGAYDIIADDRIWAYDDVKKQLVLGDIDGVHVAKMPYTIDRTSDSDGSQTKSDLDALLAKMENSAMVNLRLKSNTFIGGSPYYGTLSKYDPSYSVFDGVSYDGDRLIWRKYGDTWHEPKVYGESKTINKEQTFTSQTTLFYTGLNVTIPQGYEYKILFQARYQNSKPLETRLTTSATDTQPYLTIASGETGYCSVCGYATSEITFYLWARYAAATANKANAYGVMRRV